MMRSHIGVGRWTKRSIQTRSTYSAAATDATGIAHAVGAAAAAGRPSVAISGAAAAAAGRASRAAALAAEAPGRVSVGSGGRPEVIWYASAADTRPSRVRPCMHAATAERCARGRRRVCPTADEQQQVSCMHGQVTVAGLIRGLAVVAAYA